MRASSRAELKILIGIALAGLIVAQAVILPLLAADAAAQFPEVAYLRTPLTVLGILALACGEAALVCIWRLLFLTGRGEPAGAGALRWVNGLALALLAGTALLVVIALVLARDPRTGGGGPAAGLGLMLGMLLGAAAVAGALAWRSRLRQSVRAAGARQRR